MHKNARKICIYKIKAVPLHKVFHIFSFLGGLFLYGSTSQGCEVDFLCFITHFRHKNDKKCKKMQKNAKKLQKNLHISKICCNFAPSFQMRERQNPKRN